MSALNLEPGLHPGITNEDYHRGLQTDPRPLSSTLAKNLLRMLPAEARYELEHSERKPAYAVGTALHELLLQGDLQTVRELGFDSWRTNAAKEAREKACAEGKEPLLTKDLAEVRTIVAAVEKDEGIRSLLDSGGQTEISALTEIDGVPAQARYDYLRLPAEGQSGFILDVKTVANSAAPRDFVRNGASYGYHIQAALYQMVLRSLGYGDLPFFWLVISKKPPYAHSLIQASPTDLETGKDLVITALGKWEQIIQDGWPTSTPVIQSAFPMWTQFEIEDYENE